MPWIRTRGGITEHFTYTVPLPTRKGTADAVCGEVIHGPLATMARGRHPAGILRCPGCLDVIEGPLRNIVGKAEYDVTEDLAALSCGHSVMVPGTGRAPTLFEQARCPECRDRKKESDNAH